MVISQLPTDTAGIATLWRLIEGLSHATEGVSPESTGGEGFEFALKALVVLLTLLVLAIFCLGGAIIYIFKQWQRGQEAGIKALSTNKDKTKQEITELLKSELGNSRAANAADSAKLQRGIGELSNAVNLIILDLVVLAGKAKIPLRSSPTHITKEPPKEGE
jgi:hypothetical protein